MRSAALALAVRLLQLLGKLLPLPLARPHLLGVDERLGKHDAVPDVVRAARPLEALGAAAAQGLVATALAQHPAGARPRHRVGDTSRRDCAHERLLSRSCCFKKARREQSVRSDLGKSRAITLLPARDILGNPRMQETTVRENKL